MYDIIDALNDALTGNLSRVMQKTGSRGVAVYRHPRIHMMVERGALNWT